MIYGYKMEKAGTGSWYLPEALGHPMTQSNLHLWRLNLDEQRCIAWYWRADEHGEDPFNLASHPSDDTNNGNPGVSDGVDGRP